MSLLHQDLGPKRRPDKGGPRVFGVKAGVIGGEANAHTDCVSKARLLVPYRHAELCELTVLEFCAPAEASQPGQPHFFLQLTHTQSHRVHAMRSAAREKEKKDKISAFRVVLLCWGAKQ